MRSPLEVSMEVDLVSVQRHRMVMDGMMLDAWHPELSPGGSVPLRIFLTPDPGGSLSVLPQRSGARTLKLRTDWVQATPAPWGWGSFVMTGHPA